MPGSHTYRFALISRKAFLLLLIFDFAVREAKCQPVNLINNGSFEECVNCSTQPYIAKPKYWEAIDSSSYVYTFCSKNPPISNLPYVGNGFQFARTGNNILLSGVYCNTNSCIYTSSRGYPRNRLKSKLKPNTTYCVKFYIVNRNTNTLGIDRYGIYFADNTIDTIKYCSLPLSYLVPQVRNTSGNLIKDTLNWSLVTGTFTAMGNEKYAVLGNFYSNNATNTIVINPTLLPSLYTDVFYDDISCIELNLPAFAGRDTSILPGSPVFLGRQPDVGIDEACVWYKLPGTVPIDTIAGFWVNPTTTSTYVVAQTICGLVKSDTVVVHMNLVGLEKIKMLSSELKIYPVPAGDYFYIGVTNDWLLKGFNNLQIINSLGQMIREEEIKFIEGQAKVKTIEISAGCYSVILRNENGENVSKKLLITK